jgi:hypothetical protein
MKLSVKTLDNKDAGSIDVSDDVFGLPSRPDILARMVRWQLAKRRAGTHDTKEIGEVRGGGPAEGFRPVAPGLDAQPAMAGWCRDLRADAAQPRP